MIHQESGRAKFELAVTSEVRVLRSPGITRLLRYYDPLRDPSQPPPFRRRWAFPLAPGFPQLPRSPSPHAVLTTPVDWSGAIGLVWRAPAPGSSQTTLAFPERRAGRLPHLFFRGLLQFHSRSGLRSRSPTYSGLCHKAPVRPVTQPNRSSATKSYR